MASTRKSTKKAAAKKPSAPPAKKNKSGSKKPAAKKSASAKKAKSAAKKTAAKKKSTPKKTVAKKSVAKKSVAKKSVAKKSVAKKSVAKKKPVKSPFGKRFLAAQEAALVAEREVYMRQATNLKAEADALVADMDPGDVQFDEESGEGDTLQVERERDLVLSAQAMQAVSEIDHALAKFDQGTYGICEVSGEPIPEERLDAIPWARERVEYKVGGLNRR